jgi:DNA-binding beta-propeller fold protein YncE
MQTFSNQTRVFWIVTLVAAAGCSAGSTLQSGPSVPLTRSFERAARVPGVVAEPQPAHRAGGWLSPAAKSGKHLIYVSDFLNNAVEIYPAKGSNPSPIGQITDGISGPEGCFVDTKGDLFVSNASNATVTMYPRGSTSFTLLYTGFAYPTNVAVGANGMLYVADLVGQKVVEFPKGKTRSKRTISVTYPQGVALDSKNNLYVAYNTGAHGGGPGNVNEYASGSTNGQSLGLPIVWSAGDAIDRSGDIVVADQGSGSGNAAVYVFPPGSMTPSHTINQGLEDPFRIALDKKFKHLYVADPEVNALLVYDYPSGKQVGTITNGLKSVYGVALSPEGN